MSGHRFFSASIAGAASSKRRFWQIAMLTAASSLVAVPQADAAALFYWQDSDPSYYRPVPMAQPRKPKARRPSAKTEAAVQGNQRQAAGTADHRGLDRAAEGPHLRRQRLVRRKPGVDGHEGSFDPDGRVQRHPEEQDAPLQHLQRRTDALHAAHHLVGRCAACRRTAGLSGVARLHPHADGVCREDVELDQDGRARHHHARRRSRPPASRIRCWWRRRSCRSRLIANDPATDAPAVKSDKGADAGHATKSANVSLAHSEASLDLRPTVGHAPLRERTHTADASSALPAIDGVVTMSDATPSAAKVPPASDAPNAEAKPDATQSASRRSKPRRLTSNRPKPAQLRRMTRKSRRPRPAAEAKSDAVNVEAPTAAITKVEEVKTPEVQAC